jgi:RNA polymerase sigma factor (TIGR02999 family)
MSDDSCGNFSTLLRQWKSGDSKALAAMLPQVYDELRRVAHRQLQRERADHTLQSTALVHEAYLRLLGNRPADLNDRMHFVAIASKLIRQVLVDYARERQALKRDGGQRIDISYLDALAVGNDEDLLSLNEALEHLSRFDERQAKIVEMKFFGGLSSPEISDLMGLSRATVDRDWATARAWLHRQMLRTSGP